MKHDIMDHECAKWQNKTLGRGWGDKVWERGLGEK